MFYSVVILIVSICEIQAQVPVVGKCPEVTVQQNFDLNKYMGEWYEYAAYPNRFELPGKCYEAEYTLLANGKVKVQNSQVIEATGKRSSIEGTARPAGKSTEGKLLVSFPVKGVNREGPYWVLSTDYESYAVVWSCSEMTIKQELTSMRLVWLLTRARLPSAEIITKMYDVLDKFNISRGQLKISNQHNCTENA